MSATARLETTGLLEGPEDCQILILCEDFAAYQRAAEVCRRMMAQFASELDFDFKCWNFTALYILRTNRRNNKYCIFQNTVT